MAAQEQTQDWQPAIAAQLAQTGIPDGTTHLVVHIPDEGEPALLDLCDSEASGVVSAEDHATKVDGGEVTVVPLAQIQPLIDGSTYEVEENGDLVGGEAESETQLEPDADKGQLFDIPRPTVAIDDSDPNVLKVVFSGGTEISRGDKEWVDWYNALRAGKDAELRIGVYVAGATRTHRRDKDGNVDATVETKSITVTDVYLDTTP